MKLTIWTTSHSLGLVAYPVRCWLPGTAWLVGLVIAARELMYGYWITVAATSVMTMAISEIGENANAVTVSAPFAGQRCLV